ncbi:MAG: hypothetical protein KY391_03480 [Actinobacteria bacterium]|nr:hypothetical protein [Actinomycetota bacterium]
MSEELDLYGTGINWRKAVAIVATVSLIVTAFGFFGYRWLTSTTPVSRETALQMFEAESEQADATTSTTKKKSNKSASGKGRTEKKKTGSATGVASSGSGGGGSSPTNDQTTVAAGTESSSRGERSKTAKKAGYEYPTTPENGVYSWDTDGWEEAAGIRRQFPNESQRIITASNGSSWKQHHYFSEEREIWSEFVISKKGAHLAMQRNRAKFGPVTNDSTIDFSPPMLVGLASPKEGASWNGKWKGRTSGSYASRIFEHGTMAIGGETVEVWGYEVRMQMRGELNGTVFARVMFAPKYALTVQEHYEQTIETDRGRYRANWTMTLKSTTPQR